jgi:hypothetical protein
MHPSPPPTLADFPDLDYTIKVMLPPRDARRTLPRILSASMNFLTWTALFAIAYAQSPLYTSNQNQYFLHGLAQAGYGYLARDWLANTLDPTPLFSALVSLTYSVFHKSLPYYLFYALLMGVYLFSLMGILDHLFNLRASRLKSLLALAGLILFHSAGLRFLFSRALGVNWTYILEDGLADQRMLGPVFEPSVFGVFLMLSVWLFLIRKPYLGAASSVLAATMHPTYLLSAALLVLAFMLVEWRESREWRRPAILGGLALVLVAPILFYVTNAFMGSSAQISVKARAILVDFRIPHHARVSQWFDATAILKLAIICAGLYLARKSRLFLIMLVPALGALALTAIQTLLGSNFLALLFPWRISILLVPLSTALIIGAAIAWLPDRSPLDSPEGVRLLSIASVFTIFLSVLVGGVRFILDLERHANQPERAAQLYVYTQKNPQDTYLIPVKMQDFRLETGAPAFVDFKSIPYKDTDVLEWRRRILIAEDFYQDPNCGSLKEISTQESVNSLVIPSQTPLTCDFTQEIYRDDSYAVLQTGFTVRSQKDDPLD